MEKLYLLQLCSAWIQCNIVIQNMQRHKFNITVQLLIAAAAFPGIKDHFENLLELRTCATYKQMLHFCLPCSPNHLFQIKFKPLSRTKFQNYISSHRSRRDPSSFPQAAMLLLPSL